MRDTIIAVGCLLKFDRTAKLGRTLLILLSFIFYTPLVAFAAEIEWSGAGANTLASNPNNWIGNSLPTFNDSVKFDSINPTKDCFWDLPVSLIQIRLTSAYSGSVTAGLNMTFQTALIEGGLFHMGSFEHSITGDFTQTGGRFTTGLNGTALFTGTQLQTITMIESPVSGNIFQSYFFNLRINSSSQVVTSSNLVLDGSFSLSQGEFGANALTITLTGGSHVSAGLGSKLNWSDTGGTFQQLSGTVRFYNGERDYRINQKSGNSFSNITAMGRRGVELVSNLNISGNLSLNQTSSSAGFEMGEFYTHSIGGNIFAGPTSDSSATSLRMGAGNLTVQGSFTIQDATVDLEDGLMKILGPSLSINSNGRFRLQGPADNRLLLNDGTQFQVTEGAFEMSGPGSINSTSPGTHRYSVLINGIVEINSSLTLSSMDKNGFRLGANAHPIQLKDMVFENGPPGGVGLNFDPANTPFLLVESPEFRITISTNIHARKDSGLYPNATIFVVDPQGPRGNSVYENDPDNIIGWGILGNPTNFDGTPTGSSSLFWSWSKINQPLGFVIKDATGTDVSPVLAANTNSWVETGLSVNTSYTRKVQAFTDINTANSNSATRFTLSMPATSLTVQNVFVTSVTITWAENGNPSYTEYVVERSTDGSNFIEVGRGLYADLQPFEDTGLLPSHSHLYRVLSLNGDDVSTASGDTVQAITLPAPPPKVYSITPNKASNLGTLTFDVIGADFQKGVSLKFRPETGRTLSPSEVIYVDQAMLRGTIKLTGTFAGIYNLVAENPDRKISLDSGDGLFTVTNAESSPLVTIIDYNPNESSLISTPNNKTQIVLGPGVMAQARIYVSDDPTTNPIDIDPQRINRANAKLSEFKLIPGTIREIVAYDANGPFTHNFTGEVDLTLRFSDVDQDGVVDDALVRTENLSIKTLNESEETWEEVEEVTLDRSGSNVTATLKHFSVYGLFGALPAASLDTARTYPNPWKPGSKGAFDSSVITMTGVTESGVVRIFTLDGRLVRTLSYDQTNAGVLTWDGTNAQGLMVASGLYLIQIEDSNGIRRIMKLGLER